MHRITMLSLIALLVGSACDESGSQPPKDSEGDTIPGDRGTADQTRDQGGPREAGPDGTRTDGARTDGRKHDGSGANCTPMNAQGVGSCSMFLGYTWDGTKCLGISGCSCQGSDCSKLFKSPADCQSAYSQCLCLPMDATGVGSCKMILGYKWDGTKCVTLSGCSCQGADCSKLFASMTLCQTAYTGCP